MKTTLLILFPLSDAHLAAIGESFEIVNAPDDDARARLIASRGGDIRAVLTTGGAGLTSREIDAMPRLELACAFGAGFEGIDVAYARQRGIVVSNAPGTNDDCVADHAMALLLAAVRQIPALDRACRAGLWRDELPLPPNVSGKKLGVVGLGGIGMKIAQRAAAFNLEIGYHNRSPRDGLAFRYFANAHALAAWCDFLMLAAPGGAGTHHLVDASVLAALGPQAFLVNVGRGSVVDTEALAHALRAGAIAGAALDVYEGEPAPPAILLDCPNVILTPHAGGSSPEAMWAGVRLFIENGERHFAGHQVLTPV